MQSSHFVHAVWVSSMASVRVAVAAYEEMARVRALGRAEVLVVYREVESGHFFDRPEKLFNSGIDCLTQIPISPATLPGSPGQYGRSVAAWQTPETAKACGIG